MDPKPELILLDIERTRTALTEKIGLLEDQVKDEVEHARTAVQNTVESIRSHIDTIKRSVDPRIQVQKHPWMMMGTSVASGFFIGSWLAKASSRPPSPRGERSGPLGALASLFGNELNSMKTIVISTLVSEVGKHIQSALTKDRTKERPPGLDS
jgi:ElaB/YqjD/DUF883 family membrane-anchored ribosome-binding protein